MKHIAFVFLITTLLSLISLSARATASLSFEGEGYLIDLEIGDTDRPVVAAVRFHAPGDSKGALLPSRLISVEEFDAKRHVLVLRYKGDENGVAPFTLSVHQQSAILETGTQRVVSEFNWAM